MHKTSVTTEFIGKKIRVVSSTNKNVAGLAGIVVDETKSLFVIDTQTGRKKVQKHGSVFEADGIVTSGETIEISPEEQNKKV
jgi:RNase P/RNase MRP subunit p29